MENTAPCSNALEAIESLPFRFHVSVFGKQSQLSDVVRCIETCAKADATSVTLPSVKGLQKRTKRKQREERVFAMSRRRFGKSISVSAPIRQTGDDTAVLKRSEKTASMETRVMLSCIGVNREFSDDDRSLFKRNLWFWVTEQ